MHIKTEIWLVAELLNNDKLGEFLKVNIGIETKFMPFSKLIFVVHD